MAMRIRNYTPHDINIYTKDDVEDLSARHLKLKTNADPDDFEPGELSAMYASAVKKLKGYTVPLRTVYGAIRDSEGRI